MDTNSWKLDYKKVDDLVWDNKCCRIFCYCSCTWICWELCPGSKIGHFLAKCFHFFGYFLSLFLSLPLVPVNKIVEAFWHIRLHINEKARREATEEEKNDPDESQRKDDEFYVQEYKKEKERLTKKIDNNTSLGRSGFITVLFF